MGRALELGAEGLNQIIQTSEPVVAFLGFRIVELGEGGHAASFPAARGHRGWEGYYTAASSL